MSTNYDTLLRGTIISLVVFLCISCSGESNKKDRNGKEETDYYRINFEKIIDDQKILKLSEIADTLEYIILKTPPDIIITSLRNIIRTNNYLLINSKGVVYQFSITGDFIKQIGSIGKGPDEYLKATDIAFDMTRDIIFVYSYPRLLLYNIDGTLIKSHNLFASDFALHENTYWLSYRITGSEKFKLVALNENLDTLRSILNYDFYSFMRLVVSNKIAEPFYKNSNKLYFRGYQESDTIWELTPGDIVHTAIDLGRYKIPDEIKPGRNNSSVFFNSAYKYYGIPILAEDDQYIYLTAMPWDDNKLQELNIAYDKKKLKGFVCKNDTLNGITDDILGGLSFWPRFIDDNYYINFIEAFNLLEMADLKNITSNQFRELLSEIDENTNQIIVFAKKKYTISSNSN